MHRISVFRSHSLFAVVVVVGGLASLIAASHVEQTARDSTRRGAGRELRRHGRRLRRTARHRRATQSVGQQPRRWTRSHRADGELANGRLHKEGAPVRPDRPRAVWPREHQRHLQRFWRSLRDRRRSDPEARLRRRSREDARRQDGDGTMHRHRRREFPQHRGPR